MNLKLQRETGNMQRQVSRSTHYKGQDCKRSLQSSIHPKLKRKTGNMQMQVSRSTLGPQKTRLLKKTVKPNESEAPAGDRKHAKAGVAVNSLQRTRLWKKPAKLNTSETQAENRKHANAGVAVSSWTAKDKIVEEACEAR